MLTIITILQLYCSPDLFINKKKVLKSNYDNKYQNEVVIRNEDRENFSPIYLFVLKLEITSWGIQYVFKREKTEIKNETDELWSQKKHTSIILMIHQHLSFKCNRFDMWRLKINHLFWLKLRLWGEEERRMNCLGNVEFHLDLPWSHLRWNI